MVKNKIAYAVSATALMLGSGLFAPMTWANTGSDAAACGGADYQETDKVCFASTLEMLQKGLSDSSVESIVLNNTIAVTEDLTIDTTGKTITMLSTPAKDVFSVSNKATLTINGDGKIVGNRYIASVDNASFVLDGATLEAKETGSYGVYASYDGSATINSGSITADYAAFAGNNTTGDMNFYVNGGTLTSLRYPAIYMPGQVYLKVTDGTLNGGIVARLGQITISGGTINEQTNALANDGLDRNYGGMPSMTEAIALVGGGAYKSANAEYGNRTSLTISGGTINGEVAVYDLGNTDEEYAWNADVEVTGGTISKFTTKFTNETIGFTPKSGYTAGLNDAAGRINIEISGGNFTTEPTAEDIKEGDEAVKMSDGAWAILPKEIDLSGKEAVISEGEDEDVMFGRAAFFKELVGDREASLALSEKDATEFAIDSEKGGELAKVFDIKLVDRTGDEIEVKDNEVSVLVFLEEDEYEKLAAYDSVKVVYFENGAEAERLDANVGKDVDETDGSEMYYLTFSTTHFSTYGVVGVNEAAEVAEEPVATTPDTGALTNADGASVVNYGGLIASVVVMTAVMVAVELKKHYNKR